MNCYICEVNLNEDDNQFCCGFRYYQNKLAFIYFDADVNFIINAFSTDENVQYFAHLYVSEEEKCIRLIMFHKIKKTIHNFHTINNLSILNKNEAGNQIKKLFKQILSLQAFK